MSLLTYARKVLDKTKHYFATPETEPEKDVLKRYQHFQKLVENSDQVLAVIVMPGWAIIEQVITDTIETNAEQLKYVEPNKTEEVAKIQGVIQGLESFLRVIDVVDETKKRAKVEIKSLEEEGVK